MFNGDQPQETPEKFVSAEELGIDASKEPIQVDVFNNGKLIVDGSPKTLEEIEALISTWKQSKRMLSCYVEPKSDGASSGAFATAKVVLESGIMFSLRSEPQ